MEENKKVTSFGNRANNLLEEKVKIEDDILRQAEKILQEKKKREAETKNLIAKGRGSFLTVLLNYIDY